MAKFFINPATKKLVDAYTAQPAHALLLSGEKGIGLGTMAMSVATDLAGKASLVTRVAPEKGLLSIERIQQLYEQTRSVQKTKRVIIIDDADTMSLPAQNALLKLLEEPTKQTHFILTTHAPSSLLPTVRSRTQHIQALRLPEPDCIKLLSSYGLSDTEQRQALFLAGGRPAELVRLAEDKTYFAEKTSIVTDTREFLQAEAFTKLTIVKKYTERVKALEFLQMCATLLKYSLVKQKNYSLAEAMDTVDTVMERIEANGHVRTQMMYLVTKL